MPLGRKLGIGEDDEVAVVGAPDGFADRLAAEVGDRAIIRAALEDAPLFDVIVAFVTSRAELQEMTGRLRARMAPACGLWIAWPKRASGARTDLSDEAVRRAARAAGLVDTKVCAIDQTWSALRLVIPRDQRPRPGSAAPAAGATPAASADAPPP